MTVADPTTYVAAMATTRGWAVEWRTLTDEGPSMAPSGRDRGHGGLDEAGGATRRVQ
jgi:hypothetical protein